MNKDNPPALIFGSGLTPLGVLRSLRRSGVPAYSVCGPGELAAASRWYKAAPLWNGRQPAPENLKAYLETLPLGKAVLIPCSDDWTRAIAELPESLRERFPASIASLEAVETLTDKWRFSRMLEKLDVPRPRTILVRSMAELESLPAACFANMFLKPLDSQRFSAQTGTKAFQLESREDALRIMMQVESNGADCFPILLQEFVPGLADGYYLVDGFVDRHGTVQALIARQRYRQYPAPFGNSTLSETIPLSRVKSAVQSLERICEATRYRGIFDAEFKFDPRDGEFKIVEINPRPWWFVEFADRCGVHLCHMAYQDALGMNVPPATQYREGERCAYMFYDFAAYRDLDPAFGSVFRWLRSLRGAGEIVFCWDDPGPALSLSMKFLRKAFGKSLGRVKPSSLPNPARPSNDPAPLWSRNRRRSHS